MVHHKRMQKSVRSCLPCRHIFIYFFYFKKTCIVDLNGHTCSCNKWHSLGIAYGHAIAVARHSNMHELVDMVQVFYHADTQTFHPVPPPSEWEILDPLMVVYCQCNFNSL
uniref:Zinc finger PMZ-type domain-containing protein n=1 Tax=Lactuca sativa TaxID=4236 RepID=A0A9R1VJA7_LACSA|nr:hypothetical protein LSAT_V11C500274620 [Lactuca sativa]